MLIDRLLKLLCKVGLHEWQNTVFYKAPHASIEAIDQECKTCPAKRHITYDKQGVIAKIVGQC